jgi:hypothetical protein
MEDANPIYVTLLCILRCMIPLLVMLGISHLLRRFGFIAKPTSPPEDNAENGNNNNE